MPEVLSMLRQTCAILRKAETRNSATFEISTAWSVVASGVPCSIQGGGSRDSIRNARERAVSNSVGYFQDNCGLRSSDHVLCESGRPLAVTSITRSGAVATVTVAVPHERVVGEWVKISGAGQSEYNGFFQVATVTSTTVFTFAVTGTPATPATGTIKCTAARRYAIMGAETDGAGLLAYGAVSLEEIEGGGML